MLLVPFRRTFAPAEQDRNLIEKLRAELPGIFLWALEGLLLLRQNGGFIEPAACRAELESYRRECDPARVFLQENYQADVNGAVATIQLYAHYSDWCEQHGFSRINSSNLGKTVRRVFPTVQRQKRREGSSRAHVYFGMTQLETQP